MNPDLEQVQCGLRRLAQREISLVSELNEAEKKSVLLLLKTFLQGRQQSTNRISLEQYNREIDDTLAAVEAGDYITQEEMEKRQDSPMAREVTQLHF